MFGFRLCLEGTRLLRTDASIFADISLTNIQQCAHSYGVSFRYIEQITL